MVQPVPNNKGYKSRFQNNIMNQKQIGTILIIIGILAGIFTYYLNTQENKTINNLVDSTGTCFLEDGTCLHNQNTAITIIGIVISMALLILGLYLVIFDKTQKKLAEQHLEVSKALENAKQHEKQKDEFSAFLSGFTEDEQKILKAIHEQEGIKQSTLRYKAGMSKASLSLTIKSLEQRKIVNKKPSGKTNQLYLIKKF